MIKKESLKQLLYSMNFNEENNIFTKKYFDNSVIKIDFLKETINYPSDIKVNDLTTSNFDHPENFVVLECVNRLIDKGYKASNLELEPRWQLGRGASGGKADILVKDNNGNEYLIIECKTFGDEFDKAWKKTLDDGDQLFSYAQQIKKTQFLCLYSSDLDETNIVYTNKIIILKDNKDYLKTLKPSKRKTYKEASDVKELYKVWKDIYNLEFEELGIFETEAEPYNINKKEHSIDDLKILSFEDTQKKYNEFATILRQHNVSGHENAFDKLVNIFLAKIVDEIEHPNNLKFNWKGIAYDDYYQLQDRLQKLYKDGMQKFLSEEVTYIDNSQLNDAFKLFKNDPDATRDKVLEYFRELKFYTNNDFAFIDVHNEDLFKQNSEVLLKMVKMFQDIKLKTNEQNQFLGDLFEGFLDDGIKQSEGQFFTPLPIVRFIVSSLPLKNIIEENDSIPKVIDYACGAGHFLNEYATELKNYVPSESLQEYYSCIDGIEKEYRLSKVSKVSAFMYGQDNINITYADALSENKNIKDESYSVLIANPPYAVKGFLETLDDESRKKYKLSDLINPNAYSSNSSIETFFVERAEQLLKSNGVAGIILPSSLLSNANAVYSKAREIILKSFDIIGIVEFGNGTFGATGTNTVTLFLKKREQNPSIADHYLNRVNSWFDMNFSKDEIFEDKELLESYLEMQNYNYDDYVEFMQGTINDSLKKNTIFKTYLSAYKNNIKEIIKIEKEKLYYFMLASSQQNDVVVVNCPSQKDEIKKYLGYEWSKRKGSEGIKYLGFKDVDEEHSLSKNKGIENIKTPLFNSSNLTDENKINSVIRDNFNNVKHKINQFDNVNYYNLIDLLDFNSAVFTKTIKTIAQRKKHHVEGMNIYKLSDKDFEVGIGNRVLSTELDQNGKIPVYSANVNEIFGYINKENLKDYSKPSVLWGIDGDWNVGYLEKNIPFYPTDHCGYLRVNNENINPKYLALVLKAEGEYERFSRSNRASTERIKNIEIQLPELSKQNDIVMKIEKINQDIEKYRSEIISINDDINNKYEQVSNSGSMNSYTIKELSSKLFAGGDKPADTSDEPTEEYKYPIYSNGTKNDGLLCYSKEYKVEAPAITISARGTIGFTSIRDAFFTPVVRLITLIPKEGTDLVYLKYAIDKLNFVKTGGGAGQLTVPDFEKMNVKLPEYKLQCEFSKYTLEKSNKINEINQKIVELENNIQKIIDDNIRD